MMIEFNIKAGDQLL